MYIYVYINGTRIYIRRTYYIYINSWLVNKLSETLWNVPFHSRKPRVLSTALSPYIFKCMTRRRLGPHPLITAIYIYTYTYPLESHPHIYLSSSFSVVISCFSVAHQNPLPLSILHKRYGPMRHATHRATPPTPESPHFPAAVRRSPGRVIR